MPKNTWSQYHIHCIIIQSNNITNNPKVVVTIMLYIELRNLCRVSIHFVQTCGTHLFLCIEFSKIFYSIVNTHVYCLCVNVSMSPSMLGYDLRTSWKFWQFRIILYVSMYLHSPIFSCIEHPLWVDVFNFIEKDDHPK